MARRRNSISSTRGIFYELARILGDVQAVNNGRVGAGSAAAWPAV